MNTIQHLIAWERAGLITPKESEELCRQICRAMDAERWEPKVMARLARARGDASPATAGEGTKSHER